MTRNPSRDQDLEGIGHRILVGVDFSPAGRRALQLGLSFARERNGRLWALHVIDGAGLDEIARLAKVEEGQLKDRLGRERRGRIELLLHELVSGGDVPVQLVVTWGLPFEEIVKKADDIAADLIVLGTSGRTADIERALFGSTAEKVLRSTSRPVLCVPAD